MKKNLLFSGLIVVVLASCTKEALKAIDDLDLPIVNPIIVPPAPKKDIKISLTEFGTGLPLAGARFAISGPNYYYTDSPGVLYAQWLLDQDGKLSISKSAQPTEGEATHFSLELADHWKNGGTVWYGFAPTDLFETDTTISTPTQDSLVVSLFPIGWIRVHLKSDQPYDSSASITLNNHVLKYPGYTGVSYDHLPGGISLQYANGVDTSFLIRAKANVDNELELRLNSATQSGIIYSATKHLAKGDTLKWEIHY